MKVLLAIDDSKFSEAAAHSLATQFRPQDVDVHILNVVEPIAVAVPPQMAPGYVPELVEDVKKAREFVAGVEKTLRSSGFKVSSSVEEGDPRSLIVDEAEKWGADLIVMGSHGKTFLQRFLLGSVSDAVARHAHCSVEIIRPRRAH